MTARIVWVALGGAFGSAARYLVSGWAYAWLGGSFAFGTLAVNLLGSFLLGLLMHLGLSTDVFSPTVRIALTTGAMGGFTTCSTFSYETFRYAEAGAFGLAALNAGATVLGCVLACALGIACARWIVSG